MNATIEFTESETSLIMEGLGLLRDQVKSAQRVEDIAVIAYKLGRAHGKVLYEALAKDLIHQAGEEFHTE